MSFILDALKKSEQNRRRGPVPDVMTVHSPSLRGPKKHLLWLYLFLAAMLINAGILAAFLRPWESKTREAAVQTVTEQRAESKPAPPVKEKHDTGRPQQPVPDTPAAEGHSSPGKQKTDGTADVKLKAVERKTVAGKQPQARDTADETAVLDLNPSARDLALLRKKIREERLLPSAELKPIENTGAGRKKNGVKDISRIPPAVRKELPEISIKGHIYSDDPSSRIVNINGVIMREGDTLAEGLKLEEITMSGVILDYRGLRFSIRAF
ncbi:MAG: GspB domain-containing protein [Deferribacteres bacterium]|nr:GspB domain-containing protein [Deferribacteres bacterium]